MGNPRTRSRECALQALFYMDMRQDTSPDAVELYCKIFPLSKVALPFFLELMKGIVPLIPRIDGIVEGFSDNWKISRMSCVDRNAMRIAVYEMLFCDDIPEKVSINEAINLGKKYGTDESGAFINGILDSIRIELEKKGKDIIKEIKSQSEVHPAPLPETKPAELYEEKQTEKELPPGPPMPERKQIRENIIRRRNRPLMQESETEPVKKGI